MQAQTTSHMPANNSFTIDTRLRPLTALRAARTLINTGDTKQVFILLRAMRGRSGIRNFRRFAQSQVGRTVLREKRDLLPLLQDREALRRLPEGSVGRAYLEFMESEDLSADALVVASQDWDNDPVPPDVQRFRARMRELHDIYHVVTGYGRDALGELCLLAFTYRQNGNLGLLMVVAMAWGRLPPAARKAVREAWHHGPKTRWLGDQNWEVLLARPLEEVRQMLGIMPPVIYPPLTHLRTAR
jgi:ubiquinone biosynthesis protein COQ4